jgi:sugar phosphate isomerase/epimerase
MPHRSGILSVEFLIGFDILVSEGFEMLFPLLEKSYKKMFPFRLGTTSYIYPDHLLPNVAALAPFLDEIELVLFESESEDNLPYQDQMDCLRDHAARHQTGFNVHLPIDLFLGDEKEEIRNRGVAVAKKMIANTSALTPSTFTLHFDLRDKEGREETDVKAWRKRIIKSMEALNNGERGLNRISIETLSYPFEWIEDIVQEFGFSICLDIGHILICGMDLQGYLEKYLPGTSIIHLHGFQNGVDHLGIDRLSEPILKQILSYLHHFEGTVSLEIFSFDDLKRSLVTLEEAWGRS